MCWDAGVKLVYLPPYSPDLNLIEELFFFFLSSSRVSFSEAGNSMWTTLFEISTTSYYSGVSALWVMQTKHSR